MQHSFIGWSAAVLAALALAAPAEAAPRTRDGGSSDSGGATAVARPAPSPSPSPAPAPPPPPVVTGSGGGRSAPAAAPATRAAQRGERRAPSGGRATATPRSRGGSSTAAATSERGSDDDRRAVGRQRPRDGRATNGRAVQRTRPRPTIPSWAWHRPSYWYGYNSVGLGYFYYDPYWWGYPGYYGYGYYGPRHYGPGYGSGYGYGGGYYVRGDRHIGNVRLKVKPRDAEVRVDGYYVGVVDQYDGVFQRLKLESGPHRLEITKDGFEPLVVDIRVLPYETVTYEGRLEPQ